jgi:hypothetical protein
MGPLPIRSRPSSSSFVLDLLVTSQHSLLPPLGKRSGIRTQELQNPDFSSQLALSADRLTFPAMCNQK